MLNSKYTGLIVAGLMMSNGAWAAHNKSCMKNAKAEYRMEIKNCKTKSGDSRKACMQDAKAKEKLAKSACKKPA